MTQITHDTALALRRTLFLITPPRSSHSYPRSCRDPILFITRRWQVGTLAPRYPSPGVRFLWKFCVSVWYASWLDNWWQILVSDWTRVVTWSGYCPLIGWYASWLDNWWQISSGSTIWNASYLHENWVLQDMSEYWGKFVAKANMKHFNKEMQQWMMK